MKKTLFSIILTYVLFCNIIKNDNMIFDPEMARPYFIVGGLILAAIGSQDWNTNSGKILTAGGLGFSFVWTF